MTRPAGVFADTAGRLWVSDASHRVLRFDNAATKAIGADADGVLGQTNFTNNTAATTQSGMNDPWGVFGDTDGRLWVADYRNHRVLRFDNAALKADGGNADGVLGQTNFTANTAATTQSGMQGPSGVFGDADGRLYVSDEANHRVIIFNNAAGKSDGENADNVLGQPDFISNTTNNGGVSATSLNNPELLVIDAATASLFVPDSSNNRVKRYIQGITVTNTDDSGAGSLRQALEDACDGSTINFDLPGGGPHTITLTSGALALTSDLTISNTSGETVTVNGGGTDRVFVINSGMTATISNLTITGGFNNEDGGAAILNQGTLTLRTATVSGSTTTANGGGIRNEGVLNVLNSTISGNTGTDGGGIHQTDHAGTALTLINTTVSGNNANGFGGGVDVLGGTATIINSTITDNRGDTDVGGGGGGAGGIRRNSGTLTLHNTIVAANYTEAGATDIPNDIEGEVDGASSFNLVGVNTNMSGISDGDANNNRVGTIASPLDPVLGPLADNGGSTQTHALLSGSPAIDGGDGDILPADTFDLDSDADITEPMPVDQRGVGYPRQADSADDDTSYPPDIGAFELHPSIADITDKATLKNTAFNFDFKIGDDSASLISSVTATSSNQAVVVDGNLSITAPSAGTRNLSITPETNATGTATITVTVQATNGQSVQDSFVLTVTVIDGAPSISAATTWEDTQSGSGLIINREPGDTGVTHFKITNIQNGTLFKNDGSTVINNGAFITLAEGNAGLKFTPAADFNNNIGTASFKAQGSIGDSDSGLGGSQATASISVEAVNDAPSFTKGADQNVALNPGAQTVNNWATNIASGPATATDESVQTRTFIVTNDNNALFSVQPAISPSGALTYTPAANQSGGAIVSVKVQDNGGTDRAGVDTSAIQTFRHRRGLRLRQGCEEHKRQWR